MVVSEGAISNIMGGMENTAGVRLHSHRHKLKQRFDILRKLGQGTYGKVQLAVNKDTGQEVAIKTIKKAKIETEQDLVRIRREIQIMSSVQHPQIIHIFEVFENREKMVLVMEYAAGGELYDYLSERKVLSVEEARRVFRQVASSTYYCHKHKICHRDLKLENILLDIEGNAKIADFGLSNVFDEKRRLDTFCGSPLYASPEIVKGVPYVGPEVDCWSLGVLLYTLVYGAMPFDGSNFKRLVKQITQGDFYEPPTPSSASPLIRAMLAVTAEKRANIADICGHWWVNDGEERSCLDEAEELANQTPVRLDLLLSLAPKHISSEHMVIQPDEEDNSQRSDEGQSSAPNIQLPPPPPVPPPPNNSKTRSLSMGAIDSAAVVPDLVPPSSPSSAATRRDDEQRRRESEAPETSWEKKKRDSSADRPTGEGEEKKKMKKKSTVSKDEARPKKKSSVKKKESSVESSPMDVEEQVVRKKSVKKADPITNEDVSETGIKPEKKRPVKNKDSASFMKEIDKKSSFREKESSVVRSNEPSRESTPKASIPEFDRATDVHRAKGVKSPSNKSILSAISTDGTLKASDSSISTRNSISPAKSVIEVDVPPTSSKSSKQSTDANESKPPSSKITNDTVSKTSSTAKVNKSSSVSKNESSAKVKSSLTDIKDLETPTSTDEVLKETVTKINKDTPKQEKVSTVSKRKTSSDNSKDSSQHSSVVSTPARSRTGSESSNDNKGSRRGSKIFSKATMWDNMCTQNNDKPPPSADKGRKGPKLNMSDLTKKFEEKPVPERKKTVVGSVKISDVKKSFENKSSDKVGIGFRRASKDGSSDSIASKRESSTPVSPTRGGKKEESLPPPGKSNKKATEPAISRDREIPIKKEASPDKSKLSCHTKEKSPVKARVNSSTSPTKEVIKKEKSPTKDPSISTRPGVRRDVATPKRSSPVKEKVKPVSIAIKRVGSTTQSSKTDIKSPEINKTSATEGRHKKTMSPKAESSDSSDSESEAELLLRQLSERRVKIEAAKKEKLRKVSQQKQEEQKTRERINRPCLRNKTEDNLPPLETPSDTHSDDIPVKPVGIPKASMKDAEQPSSANNKFATLPKGFKNKAAEKVRSDIDTTRRKKSEVEITLNPSSSARGGLGTADDSKRASYAEIKLSAPSQEYKTEVRHSITPSSQPRHTPSGALPSLSSTPSTDMSSLQRAPRERIIPIMMEYADEDIEEDRRTTSSTGSSSRGVEPSAPTPFLHSPLFKGGRGGSGGPLGGVFGSPSGSLSGRGSRGSIASGINTTASPEPIRKSRRERIIPISMEGDGNSSSQDSNRASYNTPTSAPMHGRGHNLQSKYQPRPDSLSSADDSADDDEGDEEDGFHSLTAESLFSTLLSRVRNLTKNRHIPPLHHQMIGGGLGSGFSPFSNSALHGIHSPSLRQQQDTFGDPGRFWSSLYSPPRELSRQCSETSAPADNKSNSSLRGTTTPSWGATLSRDLSQDSNTSSGAVYSQAGSMSGGVPDQNTPFNTLPRAPSSRVIIINQEEEDDNEDEEDLRRSSSSHSENQTNNKSYSNNRRPVPLHDKFFGGEC